MSLVHLSAPSSSPFFLDSWNPNHAGLAREHLLYGLTERGGFDEPVEKSRYILAAPALCAEADSAEARICVRWLGERRRAAGEVRFTELLDQHVRPDAVGVRALSLTARGAATPAGISDE